jgi:hypothetical protein
MADKLTPEQRALLEQELAALKKEVEASKAPKPSVAGDVLTQVPVALTQGAADVAGTVGDVGDLMVRGTDWLARKAGFEPPSPEARAAARAQNPFPDLGPPSSSEILSGVESVTGKLPEAQTPEGRATNSILRLAPSVAAGPGSWGRKVIMSVTGGAGGEVGEHYGGAGGRAVGTLLGLGGGAVARSPLRSARNVTADSLDNNAMSRIDELGPEGFLGEATPGTVGLMQGHTRPGQAMNILRDKVRARDQLKNERISSEVKREIGPARDPLHIEAEIKEKRGMLSPDYEKALSVEAIAPPGKAVQHIDWLIDPNRGAITGDQLTGVKKVKEMLQPVMNETGGRGTKISLRAVHTVKKAIDDMIAKSGSKQPDLERHLTMLKNEVLEAVENASPDIKTLNRAYEQHSKEIEALGEGKKVLDQGKEAIWPSSLSKRIDEMTPGERLRLAQGARGEIERLIGTNPNDVATLNRLLRGGVDEASKFNYDKLALLFGKDKADNIMNVLHRELTFEENARKILHNSQTAEKQAGRSVLDRGVSREPSSSLWAATVKKALEVKDATVGKLYDSRDQELARLLTTQGPAARSELDDLMRLQRHRQRHVPWAAGGVTVLAPFRDE